MGANRTGPVVFVASVILVAALLAAPVAAPLATQPARLDCGEAAFVEQFTPTSPSPAHPLQGASGTAGGLVTCTAGTAYGLQLRLEVGPVVYGLVVVSTVSEFNPTGQYVDLPYSDGWFVPLEESFSSCGPANVSLALTFYKGYWNFSTLASYPFHNIVPPGLYPVFFSWSFGCRLQGEPGLPSTYTVGPGAYLADCQSSCGLDFHLPPGGYTVVASDEWGDAVLLHLRVIAVTVVREAGGIE